MEISPIYFPMNTFVIQIQKYNYNFDDKSLTINNNISNIMNYNNIILLLP